MKVPSLFDINGRIGCPATARPEFQTPGQLLTRMDRFGIGRALVYDVAARDYNPSWVNNKLLDQLSDASERLIPAFTSQRHRQVNLNLA